MKDKNAERWVSKYSLTTGIAKERGVIVGGNCFSYGTHGFVTKTYHHTTFQEAASRAEKMRKKKVASLKKQLAKMKALRFEEPVNGE